MDVQKPAVLEHKPDVVRALEAFNPRFKKVFAFMRANDLAGLAEGRHVIDGDEVFVNVAVGGPRAASEAKLEAHRRYHDLQVLIAGATERHGMVPVAQCTQPKADYNPDKDVVFFADAWTQTLSFSPGQFVLYTPDTAHAPNMTEGTIKKAVFKVRV